MTDPKDKELDDLIKKAQRVNATGASATKKAEEAREKGQQTIVGKTIKEMTEFNHTMSGIRRAYTAVKNPIMLIYDKVLKPVGKFLGKVFGPLIKGYKFCWNKTNKKNYEGKFKRGLAKAGRCLLLACTLGLAIKTIPDSWGGDEVRYFTTEPVEDVTRMTLFYNKKDTIWLNDVTEVNHEQGLFTLRGCKNPDNCDNTTAESFRVKNSLVNEMWSYVNKRGPFIPDQVVAPVAPGIHPYEVTSYGARWKIFKKLEAYPYAIEIKRLSKDDVLHESFNTEATKKDATMQVQQQKVTKEASAAKTVNYTDYANKP